MRGIQRPLTFVLVSAILLAVPGILGAQSPAAIREEADALEAIRQEQPNYFVRADVDHASREYRQGDSLGLRVVSENDAFLYVIYQQADGKSYQIFPNSGQPDNRVKARQTVQIPGSDDLFRWIVGPPFGKEKVKVIASQQPVKELSDPAMRRQRFNPVSSKNFVVVKRELAEQPPAVWAEDQIEITTVARGREPAPSAGGRYGVFFGVSKFEFNGEAKEASQGKWEPNMPANASSAQIVSELMRDVGKLNDLRLLTNEQATKKNLEEAIVNWLPSVSRPGDTVFIYICCHGGRFANPNADSRDPRSKYVYFFCPHDYADGGIASVLFKRQQAGKLDPKLTPRLEAWIKLIKQAPSTQQAEIALTRATHVVEDQFARWLQALDGRQIVVMLETCHAGGFAAEGKTLAEFDPGVPLQFLQNQLPRLKAIGQRDTALLAACAGSQSSYGFRVSDHAIAERLRKLQKAVDASQLNVDMCVMTYHFVDSLLKASGPLTLPECHKSCREGMRKYFETVNELRKREGGDLLTPHDPLLFDHCTKPALLRY